MLTLCLSCILWLIIVTFLCTLSNADPLPAADPVLRTWHPLPDRGDLFHGRSAMHATPKVRIHYPKLTQVTQIHHVVLYHL
jgi:hypothetical protein